VGSSSQLRRERCSEMRYSLPEESAWALRVAIEELSHGMSAEVLATHF
jgi:hypothetical protein